MNEMTTLVDRAIRAATPPGLLVEQKTRPGSQYTWTGPTPAAGLQAALLAAIERLTEAETCPGSGVDADGNEEHCGDDCGGISANDGTGEHYEAEECVHCDCCTCTPCSYARIG